MNDDCLVKLFDKNKSIKKFCDIVFLIKPKSQQLNFQFTTECFPTRPPTMTIMALEVKT